MEKLLFKNINIIGLGLIGGSIAEACKKFLPNSKIYGFDKDETQTNLALKYKAIDGVFDFKKLDNNDLVIICAPLSAYKSIFQDIKPILGDATVIDVGSLKGFPLQLAQEILKEKAGNFIACHPIAGSDKSGFLNSDHVSYSNKKVIITDQNTDKDKLEKIESFWQEIGSFPEFMDAAKHDKIFGLVSHLPQFLSFIAYENFKNGGDEILNKHFRLQNSNPEIWQEIFVLNRKNIEYYLGFFLENIDKILNHPEALAEGSNDEKHSFSHDNQNLIIRRLSLVSCFLNLPDIEVFQNHAGTGFKDFIAITSYSKFLSEHPEILQDHQESLIQFLNQIKSKITNYEFS